MAIATVTFRRCLVNSSEAGSDETEVGSRVFFDLNVEGREFVDVYSDVQANREGGAPLFVTPPQGYDGPIEPSGVSRSRRVLLSARYGRKLGRSGGTRHEAARLGHRARNGRAV